MSTHYPEVGLQSFQTVSSITADGKATVLLESHIPQNRNANDPETNQQTFTITVKIGMTTVHEFTVEADEIELINLDE